MGQDPFTDSGKIHPILAKQPPRNSGILARRRRSLYEIRASGSSRNLYSIWLVSQLCVRKISRWSIVQFLGLLFFFAFWKPVENSGKFCDFWATHLAIRADFRPLHGANSGMGFLNL